MKVNLGCGSQFEEGWINVDYAKQDGVDVVHDLEVMPWPFEDDCADHVKGVDIYEHVTDWRGFMSECWRILRPGGTLYLHTSYIGNMLSFRDPDHKRFLTLGSFDYWIPGSDVWDRYGKAYGGHDHPFDYVRPPWLDTEHGDLNVLMRKRAGK